MVRTVAEISCTCWYMKIESGPEWSIFSPGVSVFLSDVRISINEQRKTPNEKSTSWSVYKKNIFIIICIFCLFYSIILIELSIIYKTYNVNPLGLHIWDNFNASCQFYHTIWNTIHTYTHTHRIYDTTCINNINNIIITKVIRCKTH